MKICLNGNVLSFFIVKNKLQMAHWDVKIKLITNADQWHN
jgi:hypothetical protein